MKTKILLIVLTGLLLNTNNSFGQYKAGSVLVNVTGAYTIIGIEATNVTIDGGGFQIGYEVSNLTGNLALGGGLGYLMAVEENVDGQISYSTLPFWLYGKYLIGQEKAKFFLSLALGYQLSQTNLSGDIVTIQNSIVTWDGGFSFGTGAGINYYFSEKVCGILSYNLQFLNNRDYKEGLAHVFNFGLGFQLE